ncbi:DAK2 domain-containing protein [Nocardioides litoris]|uniref:DAK2 domain-containing protein n=1 Tax=Nocardioides litoris TaxID=1926648 RepID=UPI00112185EA|nr:DAK2 domain-containing protein [Nocardioides litoris]
MEQAPASGRIELPVVLRFVDVAVDALAAAREEIDALNVYPVPDGDTGTNMFLTVSAARDALRQAVDAAAAAGHPPERDRSLHALARGALLGARGNSGVILSEMLGAVARRIARATPEEPNATVMAEALHEATEASYRAVGEPVEGTMLTVSRAASDAARARAGEGGARARDVFAVAARAARDALARTPEQLPVLRHAGVVDAGGRGLSVVLDAAETVLTGRRPVEPARPARPHPPVLPHAPGADLAPGGPAYEVMYLLDADDDERVRRLRDKLATLGDSLVVVGGEGLWNVHVHVDDVGAAIEAGIEAGRPHRVRVTHFAEQVEQAGHRRAEGAPTAPDGRRVVAVAAGPGLAAVFREAGAVVVEGGPGRRPSTGEVLDAVVAAGAGEVVVLPNDADSVRAARIAASTAEADHGLRVAVVPTTAQVQGLAAMAVHEPGRSFDQDVLEMTATARHARHGAVTVSARKALTMAGWCEPGDVLGVIEGDFVVVGGDLHDVATTVLDRLLAGGGELVTLVAGEGAVDLAERSAAWLDAAHPTVDVVVYDGGQERYPLLLSVE